ncbi:MAG: Rieske (2Fe-2S) protein [Chloroflexi bacterium]|nr:Rieske (2Fe-2S) protein [Chloroflexota bacterium]
MADLVLVGTLDDFQPGEVRAIDLDGDEIALANVGGNVFAVAGTCLHRGGPLAAGHLDGSILTCPWHDWRYDVRSGELLDPALGRSIRAYQVTIRAGEIWLHRDLGSESA